MTSKMTLNSWLYLALSELPQPVQLRLETEYRAHLLDSEAPDDVRGVLGNPNEVKKQLGGLYTSAHKLKELERGRQWLTLLIHVTIVGMGVVGCWMAWHTQGRDFSQLIGPIVVLLLSAGIWRYSARLPLAKRKLLQSSWSLNSISVTLWCGWTISLLGGQPLAAGTTYFVFGFPVMLMLQFWIARREYLRLDRTLRLVGTRN